MESVLCECGAVMTPEGDANGFVLEDEYECPVCGRAYCAVMGEHYD